MKTQLKVGDRVAVYEVGFRCVGVINNIDSGGRLWVSDLDHHLGARQFLCHEKQCRKLVPKAPKRRVWIDKEYLFHAMEASLDDGLSVRPMLVCKDDIEFIEVRKKK